MSYFDKSILKKKVKNNYTRISNDFLQDDSISFEARGLGASLLSRPEDWEINISALMAEGNIGRDKVNKIIQELIKAGYMYKSQSRTSGKFSRNILFISDEKDYLFEEVIEKEITSPLTEKTVTVKPVTGEPLTANPEQQTKDYTNTNITNTTTTKKEKSSSSIYEFLIIKKYPLLNAATISNIKRFIPNLTEDEFKRIYSLTEREITIGKGKDFNAILYKALKNEWSFTETGEKVIPIEQLKNKAIKLCNYWIASPYPAEEKIKNFLKDAIDLPVEIIEEYKNKLIKFLKENKELIE